MQQEAGVPNSQYDFILKNSQKNKTGGFGLSGLPKPVLFIIFVLMLIVIIIILGSLLGGKGDKGVNDLTAVLGQAQEISRVNSEEQASIQDPSTLDLLNTTQITLASQQAQLKKVVASEKIKIDPKKLATYENKGTDSLLQTAAQNNSLNGAYTTYLGSALRSYMNSLQTAFSSSSSGSVKVALQDAYNSTKIVLASPQFSGGS